METFLPVCVCPPSPYLFMAVELRSLLPETFMPNIERPDRDVAMSCHDLQWLTVQDFLQVDAAQHTTKFDREILEVEQMLEKLKRVHLGWVTLNGLVLLDVQFIKSLLPQLGSLK